jgi:hypothetical protein
VRDKLIKKLENKRIYPGSLLDRSGKKTGQQASIHVEIIGGKGKCGYIFFLHHASLCTACSSLTQAESLVKLPI